MPLPFFDLLSDLLCLGEHQLCPALGAELHLARVAVEAHGLVSLERDALLADNDVDRGIEGHALVRVVAEMLQRDGVKSHIRR